MTIIIEIDSDNPDAGVKAVAAAEHLCNKIGVDVDAAGRQHDAEVVVWDKDAGQPLWGSSFDGEDNRRAIEDTIHDKRGGAITATGEAWEFIYGFLADLTGRHITVTLNDDVELQLQYMDDPFSDVDGLVAGRGWDGQDWSGDSISVPLFFPPEHPQSGECFIHTIHIH